jgi:hypothetical protein
VSCTETVDQQERRTRILFAQNAQSSCADAAQEIHNGASRGGVVMDMCVAAIAAIRVRKNVCVRDISGLPFEKQSSKGLNTTYFKGLRVPLVG